MTTDRRPAVFLDRDGTMIEDVGYLNRVEDIIFYPWTIDAIRALNRGGLAVVVVTNQSAIARGFLTEPGLAVIHDRISDALKAGGAHVDAYYYCPHHPDGPEPAYTKTCDCRKPAPGLVERASRDLGLDPARSFVVGDKWVDVGLARSVGARAILVRTGYGAGEEAAPVSGLSADAVVDNLAAAASWILSTC
ncbi:MAG TPA: HAD family hydrolase [Vicinamibacterales bacterium]|jgi:D-glycero-D-manno-heptose 1,7-bisphosphate phosphatase